MRKMYVKVMVRLVVNADDEVELDDIPSGLSLSSDDERFEVGVLDLSIELEDSK